MEVDGLKATDIYKLPLSYYMEKHGFQDMIKIE